MSTKQINYYVKNKYTEDIVFSYSNGEENRYRKTKNGVLLIHKDALGKVTERLLSEFEFPISEFEDMKSLSNEDYRERNKGDVLEKRHTVSFDKLEETMLRSLAFSAEDEYMKLTEKENDTDYRTIENAMLILDKCLTARQKKRFIAYYHGGKTQDEIGKDEGVDHRSIGYSLNGAKKNIKKFLEKHPEITSKIASKLYIGEGQEKQKE